MKIVHLCLSCFYIDGATYQENMLVKQHVTEGHDVLVLASTENHGPDGKLVYSSSRTYVGSDNARVIRLPYSRWLPEKVMRKLRVHPGVYRHLEEFSPDIVIFHGLAGWEIGTVARYVRKHSEVVFYADSHEDHNNSARSFVSREILHKRFYGPVLRKAQSAVEKILCISLETLDFVHSIYGVSQDRMAFFPLGGEIDDDSAYSAKRSKMREALGVEPNQVLFLQSGKFDALKKLPDTLEAFGNVHDPDFRLVIAGVLEEETSAEIKARIAEDPRISFVGWVSAEELGLYLAAADVYLQPGSQSVTLQRSLCARCAIVVDMAKSHIPFIDNNAWQISETRSYERILKDISANKKQLPLMHARSLDVAKCKLDYAKMASALLQKGSFDDTLHP